MTPVKNCPVCGAENRAEAQWCARCLTAFDQPPPPPSFPAPTLDDDYTGVGGRGTLRVIALALAIVLAVTFGANSIIGALRSDEIARQGLQSGDGFAFIAIQPRTDDPVRYDPCTPIGFVFNPQHAPPGAEADVLEAARLVEEATGLDLAYEGTTDEPVDPTRLPFQPERYGDRWAPILIGWIPDDSRIFKVDSVGVAGSAARENGKGKYVYVTGDIILNGAESLASGFGAGRTWGKVLLHEWGHVLGLDHVNDPAQVMHPDLVSSPAAWGVGDRAGLRQLGPSSGCLAVPPPGR